MGISHPEPIKGLEEFGSNNKVNHKKSIKGIIMRKSIFLMVVPFLILSIFSAGCTSSDSSAQSSPITSSSASVQITDLNLGDTAILNYNGESESVTITDFNQTSGDVEVSVKNVGNTAITSSDVSSYIYVIDWGGVKHASQWGYYPGGKDSFYPGDSDSEKYNIYQNLQDMSGEALKGKLTLYYTLGDQTASWILKWNSLFIPN